jgi:hypothetical protein
MSARWLLALRKRIAVLVLSIIAPLVAVERPVTSVTRAAEPDATGGKPATEWNALFAGRDGWIGGDVAYSVVVSPDRVLWFFGDTLWGHVRDGGRANATMANNSVGVQLGQNAKSSVHFFAGQHESGPPPAVFVPADKRGWFWPQAPLVIDGRLVLFLAQVEKTGDPGVLAGFRHVGQWLAVVDNPGDEPPKWQVTQHRLPFATFEADNERSFGSAVLVQGASVFVFGYIERGRGVGKKQLVVARVPVDKLTDLAAWRFRTADGWSAGAAESSPLAGGLATEFSVSPLADGRLVLIYSDGGLGDTIVARFADAPEGPWSAPRPIYSAPDSTRDKGLFCYAAIAHPWAVQERGQMLVSYCVNSWDFGRLFRDETVYRPQFIRVNLPR